MYRATQYAFRPPRATVRSSFQEAPARFQDVLVEQGDVTPDDLFRAIALQHRQKASLSEILQRLGIASEEKVLGAQAQAAAMPVVDLLRQPPSHGLSNGLDPRQMLQLGFVPWRKQSDVLVVAIADLDQRDAVLRVLGTQTPNVHFVLAKRQDIEGLVVGTHQSTLSEMANTSVATRLSCRAWGQRPTKLLGLALAGLVITVAAFAPQTTALGLFIWISLAILINGVYKVAALIAATLGAVPAKISARPPKLPRVSVMIPLLRETDILDRLVQRMSKLDYPKELLEIALVYEANDAETKAHLCKTTLPAWMRAIEVPESRLQTKPRALNYALDFLSGDIVGIYDAEDAPEPDQLFQVVRRFAKGDQKTACVQCALDYYNAHTNWISRCFTIEYAILFRVILPGLERLGLPIPLGGTSVFFRRDILEDLGRWDAQNVTEDADLGIRLHRLGYRCVVANSTTYEEANFRIVPWVKQRSRWLKGFLQTWATHMGEVRQTWNDLGPLGFMAFQTQMLGTFTSFLIAPIVLPMWLITFGVQLSIYDVIPGPFLTGLIVSFVLTELFLLMLGTIALGRRRGGGLSRWVLAMPLYWPLGAIAAVKAGYEFFAKPSYWDKTEHGINDHAYQAEIERLTKHPSTENSALDGSEIDVGG